MHSDDRIIKRVLDGHKEEFRLLIQRYQEQVFRAAWSVVRSRESAADVTQEAFVRAYQKLETYDSKGSFGGWIRRIAVNLAIRQLARETPVEDIEAWQHLPQENLNPVETEVIRSLDAAEMSRRLDCLPTLHRSALILRYHNDMSDEEIAEALGETVENIRYRLRYAKKMLARQMAVEHNEDLQ